MDIESEEEKEKANLHRFLLSPLPKSNNCSNSCAKASKCDFLNPYTATSYFRQIQHLKTPQFH